MKKIFIRALSLVLAFTFAFGISSTFAGANGTENGLAVNAASGDDTLCQYLEEIPIVGRASDSYGEKSVIRPIDKASDNVTDFHGNTYKHGLICSLFRYSYSSTKAWAYSIFDLEGKYYSIEGKCVLLADNQNDSFNSTLYIYGDDTLINSYEVSPGTMPFPIDIDVKGVKKLKIYVCDNEYYRNGSSIAFVGMELIQNKIVLTRKDNVYSTGKPRIEWKKCYGAVGYQVYRSNSASGTYRLVDTPTKLGQTDTTAVSGKAYYYKVRAVLSNGQYSAFCKPVKITCKPARPVPKASNDRTTGAPVISWKAAADAEGYQVYRSDSKNGTYTRIANTIALSAKDNNTAVGCSYYYKVRSIDENGIASAFSIKVLVTAKCAKPTGIKGANVKSSGLPRITWNAVNGAVKYQVYRATQKNGTYKRIGVPTKTGATDSTAFSGKTYYYKVRAVDANGEYGVFSDIVSVKCK